jgi:hypothetical protein
LVFVYLETLASIGMVGINSNEYFIITREGILKLGMDIQPCILGELRAAAFIKPKS